MAERIRQGLSNQSQPAVEARYGEFRRKKCIRKSATSARKKKPAGSRLQLRP